ncbi:MAG: hypothetical protein ACLVEJ_14195 [Parabacteroides sp.]
MAITTPFGIRKMRRKNHGFYLIINIPKDRFWCYLEREGTTILEFSEDGKTYQPVDTLHSVGIVYQNVYQSVPECTARFFRLILKKGTSESVRMVSLGTQEDVHQVTLMNAKRGLMNPLTPIGTSKLQGGTGFPSRAITGFF